MPIDQVLEHEELIHDVARTGPDEWTFRVGELLTPVKLRLSRQHDSDATAFRLSHAIKTPVQGGPYRPSRPYWDDPEYAARTAARSLTDYYRHAVSQGHSPEESWLVPVGDYSGIDDDE